MGSRPVEGQAKSLHRPNEVKPGSSGGVINGYSNTIVAIGIFVTPTLNRAYMRTEFSRTELSVSEYYRLLTAVIVPRPIAWVSSTSTSGVDNLAPHSFYTVASVDPPVVQFTSVGEKDTLRNVRATGEFVVHLASEDLLEEVNATGTSFPAEVSEFDAAGLIREPSRTVGPPRVARSPVAIECQLHKIIPVGDCHLVLGEVTHLVVATEMLEGNYLRVDQLKPLSRLGGNEWGTVGRVLEKHRIRFTDWPGDFTPHN